MSQWCDDGKVWSAGVARGDMKRADYLKGVPGGALQLVIVGKDPYPRSAVEIPFCKESLDELYVHNCSGGVVLSSLGYEKARAQKLHGGDSLSLFLALRESGIIFLNALYRDPKCDKTSGDIGKKILKGDTYALKRAYEQNEDVLVRAKNVILCGEAKKIVRWLPGAPLSAEGGRVHCVVHPDVRNAWRDEWKAWWAPDAVRIRFGLNLADISSEEPLLR